LLLENLQQRLLKRESDGWLLQDLTAHHSFHVPGSFPLLRLVLSAWNVWIGMMEREKMGGGWTDLP